MPEWLLLMAAVWFVVGRGGGCRRGARRCRMKSGETSGSGRIGPADARSGRPPGRPSRGSTSGPAGTAREEGALAALQRKYVEGVLSLEQYETELDRLDRRELL